MRELARSEDEVFKNDNQTVDKAQGLVWGCQIEVDVDLSGSGEGKFG